MSDGIVPKEMGIALTKARSFLILTIVHSFVPDVTYAEESDLIYLLRLYFSTKTTKQGLTL